MKSIKIKICGITDEKEAEYLNENKVDFAGFVLFYPKSKRNIEIKKAERIISKLDSRIKTVAVTVSPSAEEIALTEQAGFDFLQIHGNISDELIENAKIPVLRAFNVSDIGMYEHYRKVNNIFGYVFDADTPGSGKLFDWESARKLPSDGRFVMLAGGLDPENVKAAVGYFMPDGIDVSSGVENDNGTGKNREKIRLLADNVRKIQDSDIY